MATATPSKTATTKPKREPIALTTRITQQLDRAVLGRKLTKDELTKLSTHIERLTAFLSE